MIIKRGLSDNTFIILFIIFLLVQGIDIGLTLYAVNKYGTTEVEGNPIVKHNIENGNTWLVVLYKVILLPLLFISFWKVTFLKYGHKQKVNLIFGSAYCGVIALMLFVDIQWVVILLGN